MGTFPADFIAGLPGPLPLGRANVTLRQLRAFVALAQTRRFTAAAQQLHITQSALSALVKELETEVDTRLFDRTTRSVAFTVAGRDLLPVAERVLRDLEGGLATLRDLGLKRRGIVTVAVTPVLAASLVPPLCVALAQQHPGLRVVVRDRLAADNLHSLRTGEADLAIGNFGAVGHDIALTQIESSQVGAVVHRQHPLIRQRSVSWSQLVGQPLILLSLDSAFRQVVNQALHDAQVTQAPAFEVAYMGTAIGMVQAGMGIALCPSHVGRTLDRKRLKCLPMVDPVVTEGVCVATLKDRSLSAAAQAFFDLALSRNQVAPGEP